MVKAKHTTSLLLLLIIKLTLLVGCGNINTSAEDYLDVPYEYVLPYAEEHSQQYTSFQALEDFLFPLITIFDLGHDRNSGALISHMQRDEYGDYVGWVNRYGENIEAPDFLRYQYLFPHRFALYDFHNDGVLVLFVDYFPLDRCGGFTALYMFSEDGHKTTSLTIPLFLQGIFKDSNDKIVLFIENHRDGIFAYYHLILHGEEIKLELISEPDFETFYWADEMYRWDMHHQYPYWHNNPTIFGMAEEKLNPIPRLTELEEQITTSIRHRHGLYND